MEGVVQAGFPRAQAVTHLIPWTRQKEHLANKNHHASGGKNSNAGFTSV